MYGAESVFPEDALNGQLRQGVLAQQNAYAQTAAKPESQAASLLSRLGRAVVCLRENTGSASAAVDKIVGPRPPTEGNAEKNPPPQGFLGALEALISEAEQLNAALNANLQRIHSTF